MAMTLTLSPHRTAEMLARALTVWAGTPTVVVAQGASTALPGPDGNRAGRVVLLRAQCTAQGRRAVYPWVYPSGPDKENKRPAISRIGLL